MSAAYTAETLARRQKRIAEMREDGMTETEIAQGMGLTVRQVRYAANYQAERARVAARRNPSTTSSTTEGAPS